MEEYGQDSKGELVEYLKERFKGNTVKGHELALTLVVLAKQGKIKETDIKGLLEEVFEGNEIGAITALKKAETLINEGAIDVMLGK